MARQERPSITLNPTVFAGDSPQRKRDNDSDENEFKRPTRHMSDQIGAYINSNPNSSPSKMVEKKLIIKEE